MYLKVLGQESLDARDLALTSGFMNLIVSNIKSQSKAYSDFFLFSLFSVFSLLSPPVQRF